MKHTRASSIALTLCAALVGASCGSSPPSQEAAIPDTAAPTSSIATDDVVAATIADGVTTTSPATATTAPRSVDTVPSPASTPEPTPAPSSTAAPTTAPPPTPAPGPPVEYCDSADPLGSGAALMSSLTVDMLGDGSADDLVEAYAVGDVTLLRVTTGAGVISEVVNSTIDGTFRPLGIAAVFPGDSLELFAVIGEGSAAVEIGVFGLDSADCLFSYAWTGTSDDFTMLIRPGSPVRSGATCFDGGIGISAAEQQADGTWAVSSAAYEIATPSSVQYIGGSDDFDDGLAEADLGTFEFDCFGLTI